MLSSSPANFSLLPLYQPTANQLRVIVYSHCSGQDVDDVIRRAISLAEQQGYTLEWKVYGHDTPPDLKDRLLTARFEAEPVEKVMLLRISQESLAAFEAPAYEIRRVHGADGLDDVAAISSEIGRKNVEDEKERLRIMLRDSPHEMSIYVAYMDREAVACGRIYFSKGGEFAELAGGRTKTTHRNRGLYTALVAARLQEAFDRNYRYVCVDALPTSEPILRKRGFTAITDTQGFVYRPRSL